MVQLRFVYREGEGGGVVKPPMDRLSFGMGKNLYEMSSCLIILYRLHVTNTPTELLTGPTVTLEAGDGGGGRGSHGPLAHATVGQWA